MGDENAPAVKKRIKLLKWVQTDERAEVLKGPNFPHLIPVDKVPSDENQEAKKEDGKVEKPVEMKQEVKEELKEEGDDQSSLKNRSISTGDFLELGFNDMETEDADQTERKSAETSDEDKTFRGPFTRDQDSSTMEDGSGSLSLADVKDFQESGP